MPDISYQMQLMNQMQDPNSPNSPIGAMNQLANSIGNAWQHNQAGADEQAAVNYFTQNDTTPENLQKFTSEHPQMPIADAWKYASIVGRQREGTKALDFAKTVKSFIKNNGRPPGDAKEWDSVLPEGWTIEKAMPLIEGYKATGGSFKEIAPDTTLVSIAGNKVSEVYKNKKEKEIEVTSPDGRTTATIPESQYKSDAFPEWQDWTRGTPTTKANPTPFSEALAEFKGKIDPDNGQPYTLKKILEISQKPPVDSTAHDTILVTSADGKKERRMQFNTDTKKYDIPATDWAPKQSQVVNVNTGTEKPTEPDKLYSDYLKQFSADSKAGKYQGKDVRPFTRYEFKNWMETTKVENAAAVKNDAKVKTTKDMLQTLRDQAYQSAEDVKKAFKDKKLTQDDAAGILRRKFGMQ